MLLGISRTADLAGWNAGGNQTSSLAITVPVTTSYSNSFVSGRYYQDYTGITMTTQGNVNNEDRAWDTTGSYDFDQTGITNSPKLAVKAITFELGSTWGNYSTWPVFGIPYQSNGTFYLNNGATVAGSYAIGIQTTSTAGTVAFQGILNLRGVATNAPTLTVSQIQSTYANRWLGLVSATSDTSSTFANWTGGSLTARNWCQRTILVDIASQTIIAQSDEVAAATGGFDQNVDFATDQYTLFGSGQPKYFRWNSYINDGTTGISAGPWSKISDWLTVGNTFDPVTYWPYITGETPQSTVNSVQAWCSSNGSTTAGTSVTYSGSPGYRVNLSNSTRQPAGVYEYIVNPYSTTPAPVYTAFTGY